MTWLNRWLSAEIYIVRIGHGLLFVLVVVIVALRLPWWALLAGSPLVLFSLVGWLAEATIVLSVANRLLDGRDGVLGARRDEEGERSGR
jgi:hypothetical protein